MDSSKGMVVWLIVLFCLTLGSAGMGAYFWMEAQEASASVQAAEKNAKDTQALKEQVEQDLRTAQEQIAVLEKKAAELQEELTQCREDLKTQKDRLGEDMSQQLASERQKQRALQDMIDEGQQGGNRRRNRERRGFVDIERMKTENPEQYQRIVEQRQRREEQMRQNIEKRNRLVQNIDLNKLSPERRAQVERYNEITAQMQQMQESARNLSDEDRMAQMAMNRGMFREMFQLQGQVRDAVIEQAVASGDVSAVKEAYETFGGGFGGGPGFGGPRGGFGPPPGM